jgi:hypothetical protein
MAPVLTSVLHSEHAMAILLVEELQKLSVVETLPTIMGADRNDPPVLSLVLTVLSSRSSRSTRSNGIHIIKIIITIGITSFSTLIGRLVPTSVRNLLLRHHSLASTLSSLLTPTL